MTLVKDRNSEECGTDEEYRCMRMIDKGELSYVMEPTYMHCFYPLKKSETILKS